MLHLGYITKIRNTCTNDLIRYGNRHQMIRAIEELAECQKGICKVLNGGENFDHLAEEVADATIVLVQVRMTFNVNDRVYEYMDHKVLWADEDLRRGAHRGNICGAETENI